MPSNALLAHSQAKLFIADLAEGAQIERIQVRSIRSDEWEGVFLGSKELGLRITTQLKWSFFVALLYEDIM